MACPGGHSSGARRGCSIGSGKPLPVDVPVSEDESARVIRVELALSAFARGEYAIELTAGAGAALERRRLAFMMK